MEVVNSHMESMTEELNEIKRLNLYSPEAIKKLIRKRKDLEYRTSKVQKDIKDFIAYIHHEKEVLKAIEKKRKTMKITEKKSGIEYQIKRRINRLYENGMQRFPSDFNFCLSYFKFCKTLNNVNTATSAVQKLLQHFSHNPEAWKVAARFYAYDRKDKKSAMAIILKGLNTHKNDHELYKEAIELELTDITEESSQKLTEADKERQRQLECEKIKNIVDTILRDIKDIHFYVEILELLGIYSHTIPVQDLIINVLLESHSDKAIVWHAIAQRELKGLHYKPDVEKLTPSIKLNLRRCFETYQKGLTHVSEPQKTELWLHYLDCLIECQEDKKNAYQYKTQLLLNAFEQLSEQNNLKERHYITWIETLSDDYVETEVQDKKDEIHRRILGIIEKALAMVPDSQDLWQLRLKSAIMRDDRNEVEEVLTKSVQVLKEKATPVWLLALRYHILVSDDDTVEAFYQRAIQEPPEISQIFKAQYLEWLWLSKEVSEIRSKYHTLAQMQPYCRELHRVMDKVESSGDPSPKEWEKVHINACNQFGSTDVDVWISYAQFLSRFRKEDLQKIYSQAQSQLPSVGFLEFQEKFQKLEEYNKISEGNPAENVFNRLIQSVRRKCRAEQEAMLEDIIDD